MTTTFVSDSQKRSFNNIIVAISDQIQFSKSKVGRWCCLLELYQMNIDLFQ